MTNFERITVSPENLIKEIYKADCLCEFCESWEVVKSCPEKLNMKFCINSFKKWLNKKSKESEGEQ